ncbi:MAG: 1-acyl-sn-glycerol-3-phosphate acyltransferase [Burkholderiaceae bacterium]|nr:1-acyl-sn-glycerol-3-phosphate acyltransferase [Burkholderiaceae bacterium]
MRVARTAWLALRSGLFVSFRAMTVAPYAVLCLLWSPLPRHWRYRLTVGWPRLVIWGARRIAGIRHRVIGAENLPDGPAILLSKHQSTRETLFYPTYMPRELCYVFKRELLFVPFFGWGIGLLGMIHIDRSRGNDAFEQVARQGERRLAEGRWIIIFPEGTRTRAGSQGKYKSGGARLAVRTGSPVVPIAVNSGECWPRRKFLLRPGLITVSIGEPIESAGKSPEELNQEVEGWIESEMRRLSPHLYCDEARSGATKDPIA